MKTEIYPKAKAVLKVLMKGRTKGTNYIWSLTTSMNISNSPWYHSIRRISDDDIFEATRWLIENGFIKEADLPGYDMELTSKGLHFFEMLKSERWAIFWKSFVIPFIVSIATNIPNWWPWLLKWVSKR